MATIRNRGRFWEAQVRLRGFPRQSATFDTQHEARAWATRIEADMRAGRFRDTRLIERTTLGEALERFADELVDRGPNGRRERNRVLRICQYPLAQYAVANIKGREIVAYVAQRSREGAGANTIRLDLASLGRLFEIARKEWGWPVENPVRDVRKPKLPKGRNRRLNDDEEYRLLSACSPSFSAVVKWALETAMRREEIARLRWEHIDRRGRTAYLPETKNGDARTVPLSRKALSILDEIPRHLDGSVFDMSPNAITLAMRRATEKAEIDDLRFHDLRHEAISRLFENTDLDALEISRITGHRTMQMLSRYTHLRAGRLADRLDGHPRGTHATTRDQSF